MAAELTDFEAKLKAAREEGLRDGETNAKLSQVLRGMEKMSEQIALIQQSVAPVQLIANRALDASNANTAALLSVNARIGAVEGWAGKATDIEVLDRRIDALDVKIAYAAGVAAIAGAVLAYIVQQLIQLAVR
jgi:hypothetical protein